LAKTHWIIFSLFSESVLQSYKSTGGNDLGRTHHFLEEVFHSGAATCLICIATVKHADAVINQLSKIVYLTKFVIVRSGIALNAFASSIYRVFKDGPQTQSHSKRKQQKSLQRLTNSLLNYIGDGQSN
jgi:hypothetical protein